MKKWTKKVMMGFTALTMMGTVVTLQEPIAVEASAVVNYKTTADLNLRTGASVKHKKMVTIPKGKQVQYVSKKGNWYKVKYGNKTGFVSASYLKKASAPKAKAVAKTHYKTTANLNLRPSASTKHKKILTIPKGKQVQYVSKSGSWYKVKYGTKTGFVSASYLSKVGTTAKPKQASVKAPAKAGYTKKVMDVEVTAYTFGYGANLTASGKKLKVGHVSAPREISFGSIIDLPGIEKQLGVSELKVYDRGGAIKRLSNKKIRIDVAFPTRAQALKFGRKTYKNVPVYIKK